MYNQSVQPLRPITFTITPPVLNINLLIQKSSQTFTLWQNLVSLTILVITLLLAHWQTAIMTQWLSQTQRPAKKSEPTSVTTQLRPSSAVFPSSHDSNTHRWLENQQLWRQQTHCTIFINSFHLHTLPTFKHKSFKKITFLRTKH